MDQRAAQISRDISEKQSNLEAMKDRYNLLQALVSKLGDFQQEQVSAQRGREKEAKSGPTNNRDRSDVDMASRSRTPAGRNDWSQFLGANPKAELLPTIAPATAPLSMNQEASFPKNTPN